MELFGIDVSHWNTKEQVANAIGSGESPSFVFVKATEGTGFRDSAMMKWIDYFVEEWGVAVIGLYHFARPEISDPESQAKAFVARVTEARNAYPDTRFLMALDWEGEATREEKNKYWAYEWLHKVYVKTATRPLIYCSQSVVSHLDERIAKENFGLWVAHYAQTIGSIKPWEFAAFWQYTSKPVDKNKFFGTMQQLTSYAMLPLARNEDHYECQCGCMCHTRKN